MKIFSILIILFILLTSCFSKSFKSVSYNATFEAIDASKDGIITIDEFTTHFPNVDDFPVGADADLDGQIYPDEWFEFREERGD